MPWELPAWLGIAQRPTIGLASVSVFVTEESLVYYRSAERAEKPKVDLMALLQQSGLALPHLRVKFGNAVTFGLFSRLRNLYEGGFKV